MTVYGAERVGPALPHTVMARLAVVALVLALCGCGYTPYPTGQVPSYRVPFQNAPTSIGFQPPNSYPR